MNYCINRIFFRIKKYAISCIIISIGILLVAAPVHAARLYMSGGSTIFPDNAISRVDVLVASSDETINVVSGTIKYPTNLLNLVDIRTGSSLVSFWVDPPKKGNGEVSFSGVVPGGFNGEQGYLFSMYFSIPDKSARSDATSGAITIPGSTVLLHDGVGTAAVVTNGLFNFSIVEVPKEEGNDYSELTVDDSEAPEEFDPIITKDDSLMPDVYMLIFSTQDKGGGISHYEIIESPIPLDFEDAIDNDLEWQKASSPYVLQDQGLESWVYVKAIDKAGNAQIVSVSPTLTPASNSIPVYLLLFAIIFLILLLLYLLWRTRKYSVRQS